MPFIRFLRFSYFLVFSLSPILLFGQYYNLGQDPASLKWRQIRTPHFRIIYPENFEQKALKMLPTLDMITARGARTLDFKPDRLPLIVNNYNITSNAVTVWAPKRIELYSCPPQDSYAQDWMDQLMIHEYRHVVQFDRANQGFTRVLSWLTGEQAATMVTGLYVPSWFMEGDAVCTETALSHSGRGRIPGFEMRLRAQVIQKNAFSYDKAALGSYKTFVPNQYELGYPLVANVRRKFGYKAWVSALDEVARKPFLIIPFNHGLKKVTGFGKEDLYRMTMLEMDSMWKYQDLNTHKTDYKQLTIIDDRKYENYAFPKYINDTLIVAEYTSMDDITRFVMIGPAGYKQTIATPGFLSSDMFSLTIKPTSNQQVPALKGGKPENNYLLAWTETINDPRWEQRNYSVIRIFNRQINKTSSPALKSRYFAPSFSPDGHTLAAVSVDPSYYSSIVLIDAIHGFETATIIGSDSDFYMTPTWSEDGTRIVFTKLDSKGKSIIMYDIKSQVFTTLLPSTYTEISNPVFANGYVLFNGSYSGIENIYAINLKSYEIFQVISAEFGANNADLSPDGKKIVYSNYTANGYGLAETVFNPALWKKLSETVDLSPSLYKFLVKEEGSIADTTIVPGATYPSHPYKKAAHIFNFHSWAPAYINYMSGENGTGVSFMSQNELSTATTVIGYKYDIAENTGKVTADFSWKAWYPMIDLNTSYGVRAAYTGGDTSVRYNFNETIISGGFTLPLIFTGGKYYEGLDLKVHASVYKISDNTSPEEDKLTGIINSFDYSFNAYRFIKQSGKDIYPRWGQVISGSFRHSPFGNYNLGNVVTAGARLYFPGLMPHHGIRIDVNRQVKNPGKYAYSNQIAMPRGYLMINQNTLTTFAFNYKFPFAYPDLVIGPIVYLKRLKANLFFDGGEGITHGISQKLQSTGVEITSDLHLLRFIFPVDIGFRFGYRPIEKQYFSDFLFSVNLSN